MRVFNRFIPAMLLIFGLSTSVSAGIVGNTSMNLTTSARAAGMGYAFTAVADDGSAIDYNPAGLYQINKYYWSFMHLNLRQDVYYEYMNGALDTKYGTIGASVSFVHLGEEPELAGGTGFRYYDLLTGLCWSREMFNLKSLMF